MAIAMRFFLYAIRRPTNEPDHVKIGHTGRLAGRESDYLVSCDPGSDDDLAYVGIWETTAGDEQASESYEKAVHDAFSACRRPSRGKRRTTEWFAIPDALVQLDMFITRQPWFTARQSLDRRTWPGEEGDAPAVCVIPSNARFLSETTARQIAIDAFQAPIVETISQFITSNQSTAHVVAACGCGKTRMTIKAIERTRPQRIVIVCPSLLIVGQWRDHLVGRFPLFCDGRFPTPRDTSWCIIITNQSSAKLISLFATVTRPDLVVFDEVHHMVGKVAETGGEGETRRFVQYLKTIHPQTKRFGLTYTPRNVASDTERVLSMDREADFGPCLDVVTFRDLVTRGILPDYRIAFIRDANTPSGARSIESDAACLKKAWERVDQQGRPLMTHLLVCCFLISEAAALTEALQALLPDVWIAHLNRDAPLNMIETFQRQPLAILVNCKMLNEGVDIPRADAVALMYPKRSFGDITQTVLRPGRWAPDKPLFHVLVMADAVEEAARTVLLALAEQDTVLSDQLTFGGNGTVEREGSRQKERGEAHQGDGIPDVIITLSDSDRASLLNVLDEMRRERFACVRGSVLRDIQRAGLRTAAEYFINRKTTWPSDPAAQWPEFVERETGRFTWTAFLKDPKSAALYSVNEAKKALCVFRASHPTLDAYACWEALRAVDPRCPSVFSDYYDLSPESAFIENDG